MIESLMKHLEENFLKNLLEGMSGNIYVYIVNIKLIRIPFGEKIFKYKLHKLENKTGISFEYNTSVGKGLIIGHWGKIVINGETRFGNYFFITHGVTIGRDIRGKREGVPTFGDRVCVRANSTIVGRVKIGNDVLIAPNTFVNFDVPDHSIVIGNPAKIIHRDNATEGHIPLIYNS